MFSRDKVTNDANRDVQLNRCLFFIYAWSGNASITTGIIQYHGSRNRKISQTLVCLPSADFCPERCKKSYLYNQVLKKIKIAGRNFVMNGCNYDENMMKL